MRDLRRKNEEVEREKDESEKERERMRHCIEQLRTKLAQVTAQVASAQASACSGCVSVCVRMDEALTCRCVFTGKQHDRGGCSAAFRGPALLRLVGGSPSTSTFH